MSKLREILASEGLIKTGANTFITWLVQGGDEPGAYTILDMGVRPQGGGSLRAHPSRVNLDEATFVRKFDQMVAKRAEENYQLALRNKDEGDPFYRTWVLPKWQGGPGPLEFPSIRSELRYIQKIADRGYVAEITDGLRGWETSKARRPRKKVPLS